LRDITASVDHFVETEGPSSDDNLALVVGIASKHPLQSHQACDGDFLSSLLKQAPRNLRGCSCVKITQLVVNHALSADCAKSVRRLSSGSLTTDCVHDGFACAKLSLLSGLQADIRRDDLDENL
jgi:hypothetical protein